MYPSVGRNISARLLNSNQSVGRFFISGDGDYVKRIDAKNNSIIYNAVNLLIHTGYLYDGSKPFFHLFTCSVPTSNRITHRYRCYDGLIFTS